MSAQDPESTKKNIIDMAEARRRQKILAAEQKKKKKAQGNSGGGLGGRQGITFWGVLQFILFMVAIYFLMDTCSR